MRKIILISAGAIAITAMWALSAQGQGSGLTAAQRGADFDEADLNKDGRLDPYEFLKTRRGGLPFNPIVSWLASDKDKDGFVGRQEFVEPMIGENPNEQPATMVVVPAPTKTAPQPGK